MALDFSNAAFGSENANKAADGGVGEGVVGLASASLLLWGLEEAHYGGRLKRPYLSWLL